MGVGTAAVGGTAGAAARWDGAVAGGHMAVAGWGAYETPKVITAQRMVRKFLVQQRTRKIQSVSQLQASIRSFLTRREISLELLKSGDVHPHPGPVHSKHAQQTNTTRKQNKVEQKGTRWSDIEAIEEMLQGKAEHIAKKVSKSSIDMGQDKPRKVDFLGQLKAPDTTSFGCQNMHAGLFYSSTPKKT